MNFRRHLEISIDRLKIEKSVLLEMRTCKIRFAPYQGNLKLDLKLDLKLICSCFETDLKLAAELTES